jgi:hypothetical protein
MLVAVVLWVCSVTAIVEVLLEVLGYRVALGVVRTARDLVSEWSGGIVRRDSCLVRTSGRA